MPSKQVPFFMSLLFFASVMSAASTSAAQPAAQPAALVPTAEPVVDGGTAPADLTPEEAAEKKVEDILVGVDEDPSEVISNMVQAFKEGRWAAGIGLLLTLLVWFTRRFVWKFIPKNALPWLTFGLAMLITVSLELISGLVWWKTLIDGFLTCGAAMAFWTLLFKKVAGDKKAS
jgi:hypothetical protein